MSFPRITTKTKNITLTTELKETLEKCLKTLARLLPEKDASALFEVDLSRTTKHHQAGKVFCAELNLSINGELIRAEAVEETIEAAIDHAKNELKRELIEFNSRVKSLARKGARRAKEITQRS